LAIGRPALVIAVVGKKGSGKTRLVEELVKALREEGYKVSTAKHVPEEGFSIDTPGKDSWRHAEAGAMTVAIVAPREMSLIKRLGSEGPVFDEIISLASHGGPDILIMEGFRSIVGSRLDVPKVVLVSGPEEARAMLEEGSIRPILAFVGPGRARGLGAPYVSFGDIAPLVEMVREKVEEVRKRRGAARLFVNGVEVPLNRFVSEVLRKVVLAFVSCLKGVDIRGDERIEVSVRGA